MKLQDKFTFLEKEYLISTVELLPEIKFIDHLMGETVIFNFETMIFKKDNKGCNWDYENPIYTKSYNTIEEAIRGHKYCMSHIWEFIK